jgi:hypothetical protein
VTFKRRILIAHFISYHGNRVVLEMLAETICLSRTGNDFGSSVSVGGVVRVDVFQCQSCFVHLCYFCQLGQGIL